jgi:hypothetical protein
MGSASRWSSCLPEAAISGRLKRSTGSGCATRNGLTHGQAIYSSFQYFVYGPEQDTINLRCEYLEHTLEISTRGDSSVYLLNPKIVGADGEWEAWFFANWAAGAYRYKSFAEMMLAHYQDFQNKGLNGF